MAGITIVSFPIGYYLGNWLFGLLLCVGRGNGKFVQKATMYTTAALGLMGGYSIALVNTRKRILSQ